MKNHICVKMLMACQYTDLSLHASCDCKLYGLTYYTSINSLPHYSKQRNEAGFIWATNNERVLPILRKTVPLLVMQISQMSPEWPAKPMVYIRLIPSFNISQHINPPTELALLTITPAFHWFSAHLLGDSNLLHIDFNKSILLMKLGARGPSFFFPFFSLFLKDELVFLVTSLASSPWQFFNLFPRHVKTHLQLLYKKAS